MPLLELCLSGARDAFGHRFRNWDVVGWEECGVIWLRLDCSSSGNLSQVVRGQRLDYRRQKLRTELTRVAAGESAVDKLFGDFDLLGSRGSCLINPSLLAPGKRLNFERHMDSCEKLKAGKPSMNDRTVNWRTAEESDASGETPIGLTASS